MGVVRPATKKRTVSIFKRLRLGDRFILGQLAYQCWDWAHSWELTQKMGHSRFTPRILEPVMPRATTGPVRSEAGAAAAHGTALARVLTVPGEKTPSLVLCA